jgi:RNA polymerase sigma factor (sigma-70 family)
MGEKEGMEGRSAGSNAERDLAWVTAALEGDQAAYISLLETYRENIYYMMLKMVRNQDDAEDLTIEAFGKAFKRLPSFNPEYAFSTWLFRIASNNAIDFIRKKKKSATLSLDQDDDDESSIAFDVQSKELNPEQELVKGQHIEEMHKLIDALKPKYKKLVELRYLSELSYDEIADEMDLPLGTVKAQLFRARELMFEIMKHRRKHI